MEEIQELEKEWYFDNVQHYEFKEDGYDYFDNQLPNFNIDQYKGLVSRKYELRYGINEKTALPRNMEYFKSKIPILEFCIIKNYTRIYYIEDEISKIICSRKKQKTKDELLKRTSERLDFLKEHIEELKQKIKYYKKLILTYEDYDFDTGETFLI
jgi:hypothetical protein